MPCRRTQGLPILTVALRFFTLVLTDFVDSIGTITGLGKEAGFVHPDGTLPGAGKVLAVDALGAVAGSAASSSSNTVYIESAAGIAEGARTGLAAVVTGVLFLAAMFFTPLYTVIPIEAAAPGPRRLRYACVSR
jgi:AGZA family xanthine/uracil permease-like MFS transporter